MAGLPLLPPDEFQKSDYLRHRIEKLHVYIVRTMWHAPIVDALVQGAREILQQAGVSHIHEVQVAGSFELPQAVALICEASTRPRWVAVIALGVIIRGGTYHDELIAQSVTQALQKIAVRHPGIPIGYGLVTAYDESQAWARASQDHNKGADAAIAVLYQLRMQAQVFQ